MNHKKLNHKKTHRNCLAALLALAMISAPHASADGTAFGEPEGATRTDGNLVAGLAFNASTDGTAQVNRVGYWDQGGDGLDRDHVVGLFQRDPTNPNYNWKLLAKATVTSASPLEGGYRWADLGTTILLSNTTADGDYGRYAVLAETGSDPWGNRSDGVKPSFDPAIVASIANYSSFWYEAQAAIGDVGTVYGFMGNENVFAGPNIGFSADTGTITAYDTWIAGTSGYFPGVTDSLVVGPTADPDKDGKPNFLEFALNSKPNDGGSDGAVFVKLATVNSVPNVLTLTAAVRATVGTFAADGNNQKATDTADSLTYIIEAATDLTAWGVPVVTELTGADATAIQTGLPLPDSGWVYKTFRTDGAAPDDPADFIRVKITSP
jgi:hypothetical protein